MDDSFSDLYDSDDAGSENGLTGGHEAELDYYAILNVQRDATIEDIQKAYKHRCRIFHPDRHTDEDDKAEAEKIFVQLQNAYSTLSDPKRRAIYDAVGSEGLDYRGWDIIEKSSFSDDIRRQFEFLKRLREQELMLTRVHPGGAFSVRANCTGMFHRLPEDRFWPQFTGLAISQAVDCSLTTNDKISLVGRVKSSNGRGDGNFQMAWKKSYDSTMHFENTLTFQGDSIQYSFKVLRTIFEKAALVFQPSIQFFPLHGVYNPSVSVVFSQQLRPEVQGTLAYTLGPQSSSLTTSIIVSELNHPKIIANLTLSPVNPNARLVYNKRYAQHDSSYEYACSFSPYGLTPSLNFERRLGKFSKIGCGITFTYPSFLLLVNFKLKTGFSTYQTSLTLCDCEEDICRTLIYGTILPYATFELCKLIFHKPIDKFMRLFSDSTEELQVNAFKKEESVKVHHLMRPTAERIAKDEDRKQGLVIIEAKYGEMANAGPSAAKYPVAGDKLIDVTIPLQAMVNDSQLRIYSNKSQLPGFYDPCPGQPKMLKVTYKFRGEMHLCTVADEYPLNIPLSGHRLNN